jgi:hypothetical protein
MTNETKKVINYTKCIVDKYEQYIAFDDADEDIFEEMYNIVSKEDVTVDPNNCIKVWTYNNEEEERPTEPFGSPYIFANQEDMDFWMEYNNSDGHQNNPYYMIVVIDGVETHYAEADDIY